MNRIPIEVLYYKIYELLTYKELRNIQRTNKYMYMTTNNYWRDIVRFYPIRYAKGCSKRIQTMLTVICKLNNYKKNIEYNNI